MGSGAGTNSGAHVRRKAPEKNFLAPLHFLKCPLYAETQHTVRPHR